jgi:uncharacterized membrane protein YraQ (UPF0718 family)
MTNEGVLAIAAVFGLIHLGFCVYMLVELAEEPYKNGMHRALWIAFVIFVPLIGFVLCQRAHKFGLAKGDGGSGGDGIGSGGD